MGNRGPKRVVTLNTFKHVNNKLDYGSRRIKIHNMISLKSRQVRKITEPAQKP